MASNFRIKAHRRNERLHLELRGDFDGSAAYELIRTLEKFLTGSVSVVFINTQGLRTIYPFGSAVFQSNFPMAQFHSIDFIFSGPHGEKLAAWKEPNDEKRKIRLGEEFHGQNDRDAFLQTRS